MCAAQDTVRTAPHCIRIISHFRVNSIPLPIRKYWEQGLNNGRTTPINHTSSLHTTVTWKCPTKHRIWNSLKYETPFHLSSKSFSNPCPDVLTASAAAAVCPIIQMSSSIPMDVIYMWHKAARDASQSGSRLLVLPFGTKLKGALLDNKSIFTLYFIIHQIFRVNLIAYPAGVNITHT